jgi:hypothetical protein
VVYWNSNDECHDHVRRWVCLSASSADERSTKIS